MVVWGDFKMKSQEFKEIQTKRLDLKPLCASFDFANYLFNLISKNREFFKFMPWVSIENAEQEFDWLRSAESNWKNKKSAAYGMFLTGTDKFIGVCSFFDINWTRESAEIGYWLDPKYSKQNFMTEAVNGIVNEFFNVGFKRIIIKACPENIASCKTAEKCGFELEGLLHSYDFLPAMNKRVNAALYARIKEK